MGMLFHLFHFIPEILVEWFAFRIFHKLSKEMSVPSTAILNVQKCLVQRKAFPSSLNYSIPEDRGATSYNSLHREVPPQRCTLLILSLSLSKGRNVIS